MALMYDGIYEPSTVLTGQNYWNGIATAADPSICHWNLVGGGLNDMMFDHGGGIYLQSPITGDQYGNDTSKIGSGLIEVWTSFQPSGTGTYTLLSQSNYQKICSKTDFFITAFPCLMQQYSGIPGPCPPSCTPVSCSDSNAWYGISNSKTRTWAYNLYKASGMYCTTPGIGPSFGLYCVEQ